MQTHTEAPTAVPTRRAHSLDALRGYAIMTMILAATEALCMLLTAFFTKRQMYWKT